MFIKSIHWRIQIWYGLLLLIVLAGFGFTAFQLERGHLFRAVDDELQRRVVALRGALRPPPRRGHVPPENPFDHPPPPPAAPQGPSPDMEGRGPDNFLRRLSGLQLPGSVANLFSETDSNGFYYAVFALPDGTVLLHSANLPPQTTLLPSSAPRFQTPGAGRINGPFQVPPPEPPKPQNRALYREVSIADFQPQGHVILVGRSIAPELGELHRFGAWLTLFGAGVLLAGLAGGSWLASRALKPIEDISATATRISVGDLSHRINMDQTDSELGRLATVLNSTFARLEAAFTQQKQFASDAAHELRTPVAVMLTQTQTALNRERSAVEYRETVESCQRAAQRMRRLIESLLELARLDAGQETIKRQPLDLAQVTRDCVALISPLAADRSVTIHCELPAVPCLGDADRLAQVITNLLTNAVQYNKPNGEVRISLQSENATTVLTVSDTGEGISPSDLPHIFKRFFRADASRSGTGAHSGLGLAIARAIVEAHGGTIQCSSQREMGSVFTIQLPA